MALTSAAREAMQRREPASDETERSRVKARDLTEEDVRAALARAGGVQERAWQDLDLANRYVLKRLVKKYGIKPSE